MGDGVRGVAVAANRRPHRRIVPVGNICMNRGFELFLNLRVAPPARLGNVSSVHPGSWIFNRPHFMITMAIFACGAHGWGSGLSGIAAMNAVQVGPH